MFYADDLVIHSKNIHNLKAATIKIEKWSEQNGMIINKSKSAIMQCGKNLKTGPRVGTKIRGYPVVDNYKFLGIKLDRKLKLEIHTKYLRKTAQMIK